MNGDLYFDGKQYISSSRAAKISGYVNDYIGQLCRDGKLECRMVGRSWYVSLDSLISHKSSNGGNIKSRAKKNFSRVTNSEFSEPESLPSEQISGFSVVISKVGDVDQIGLDVGNSVRADEISIPINISTEVQNRVEKNILYSKSNDNVKHVSAHASCHTAFEKKFPKLVGITIAFLFAISVFGSFLNSNYQMQLAYREIGSSIEETFSAVLNNNNYLFASATQGTHSAFDRLAINFYETVSNVLFDTQSQILALLGHEKTPVAASPHIAQAPQNSNDGQGMVVVPVDERTNQDEVIAKIKDSFSDEVQVVPKQDGVSGVITPVFRRATNDNYLYVLVPIKN